MKILWTKHARYKTEVLREHGFPIRETLVEEALKGRPRAEMRPSGEKIARMELDADHVLRIVFSESAEGRKIITIYPARRRRYEA
ncbi:MAG: hypothetical protein HY748_07670 [Elusimicrobia bacterium]|nr:hypothetical protein [Elusimicrobiota bacterium]